jgi:hypothetical protein
VFGKPLDDAWDDWIAFEHGVPEGTSPSSRNIR